MSTTLIILLLIVLAGFTVLNFFNLYYIRKKPLANNELNDKKYWELYHKMQYMITIFAVLLTIAGYLGYKSLEDVKDEISRSLQIQLNKTNKQLAETDVQFSAIKSALPELGKSANDVKGSLLNSRKELGNLQRQLSKINSKDIIKQDIYIIKNIPFDYNKDYAPWTDSITINYSTLKTVTGQTVPTFDKSPFIIALGSSDDFNFQVKNVNRNSFDFVVSQIGNMSSPEPVLIISYTP